MMKAPTCNSGCASQTEILRFAATGFWPQPPSTWFVLAESAKSVGQPEPFATLVTIFGLSQATAARHE